MIFARAILGPELILVGAIGVAMGLIYAYLRQRGQLAMLRHVGAPALLWAIFGSLDALVTIVGTWGAPWHEANPLLRAWLFWDGWVGQVIYTFLYILLWAALVIGLEEARRRTGGVWAALLGALQLIILYRLALEHFYGFTSWTPYFQPVAQLVGFFAAHTPWLFTDSLVGYVFDFATALATLCAALHLAIAALFRWLRRQSPSPAGSTRALAGPHEQVARQ